MNSRVKLIHGFDGGRFAFTLRDPEKIFEPIDGVKLMTRGDGGAW